MRPGGPGCFFLYIVSSCDITCIVITVICVFLLSVVLYDDYKLCDV